MRTRGDWRQAKEAYRSSFAIAERLTTFHPGNEELQRNQAEAFGALLTASDANGFGATLNCTDKGRTGCPILQDASALASEGSVETPAEKMVAGHSRELSVEVKNRTASKDATVQLIDNVPRKMRVGSLERIEVRIARRHVSDAMTARLWAPDGGWLVEPLSAETLWPHQLQERDFASWKWSVIPQRRGRAHLHLAISTQTLDANGVAAEATLPKQVIKVHVRANYGRMVRNVAGWGLLMLAGAALNALGREKCPAAVDAVMRAHYPNRMPASWRP